ncbi:hypothetical protein L486_01908 [Kwoniella mangroviensis CBS 10435]|uniref:Uncharacterized protein n=1 Tax=Kwoniella mangroviensis CBS 10435 TaxID=1331196 RepID=A0A1B9J396_9TREE|nr:hypothetical protein L486_01908 [Kwoniella mangroviensis CBS 10435]
MNQPPQYSSYPGIGQWGKDNLHYSQTARIGNVIETSGQGGWDPVKTEVIIPKLLDEEIDQAFQNINFALTTAGGKGFSQEVDAESSANIHAAWYDRLAVPGMRVEIEAWAYVEE